MNVKTLVLFLSISLTGCVSLPKDQQTENLIIPPSLQDSVEKGLQSGIFKRGDWPEENWWELFDSAQLSDLVTQALQQNPSILAVQRQIEFAKQTAKVVRSRLFPLIFFDADDSWEYLSNTGLYKTLNPDIPRHANLIDLTFSFTYEFDFWSKNRNLFQAALGQAQAQAAEAAQVKLIVTTAVAQAYFALKTNLLRKKLYQELYDVRASVFELQSLLEEKALLSKLTPLFSKENVLEVQKMLLDIEQEIEVDRHLINNLIGKGPDHFLELDDTLSPLPVSLSLPSELSIDLLARRPDLMAQIWRAEALVHEVGAAKADFLPNVNLVGFTGLESILYSWLFQGKSYTMGLEPTIHLPIFTAGAIRANLRAKKALFDQAIFEYNKLILSSAQEVADLLIFAQTVFEKKERQDQIVEEANKRYNLTAMRNASGLDNVLANYALEEEVINKKLENVTLLYNQYLSAIKLIKSLGGGYYADVPLEKETVQEGT